MKQYIDGVGLGTGENACRFVTSYLKEDAKAWWRSFSKGSTTIFTDGNLDLESLFGHLEA